MNEFSHSEHGFDPQVLDRLVDGELADGERRTVLESLERLPDGWRQCALAFLEAQTWGQTLTDYVRQPNGARLGEADEARGDLASREASVPGSFAGQPSQGFEGGGNVPASRIADGPDSDSSRREAARSNRIRTALAIAGSFLVTFSLGMYAQRYLRTSDEAGSAPSVVVPKGGTQQGPAATLAGPIQYASFDIVGGDGRRQTILAPLVNRDFAQLFVPTQAPPVPDDLAQRARQLGAQIRFHREFFPVPVGDRQALVPFDRFEIVPVSNVVR